MDTIPTIINTELELQLNKYIDPNLIIDLNIDNIFNNKDDIFIKPDFKERPHVNCTNFTVAQKEARQKENDLYMISYNLHNEYKLKIKFYNQYIINALKYLQEILVPIKIYKSNIIHLIKSKSDTCTNSSEFTYNFYTNTNLEIEIIYEAKTNNQSYIKIILYIENNTNVNPNTLYIKLPLDSLCISYDNIHYFKYNTNKKYFENIINKTITYINPLIYLDYLMFNDENKINNIINAYIENPKLNKTINYKNKIINIKNNTINELNTEINNLTVTLNNTINITKQQNDKIDKLNDIIRQQNIIIEQKEKDIDSLLK
jgi:hypothetical protein